VSLAIAVMLIFVGSTLIWVASHGTDATTPWQLYKQVTDQIGAS